MEVLETRFEFQGVSVPSFRIVEWKNRDLTDNGRLGEVSFILIQLTEWLKGYSELFDTCQVFLIEQQMQFGKKRNPMAVRLAHHLSSYLYIRYASFREIIDFPASNKTRVFLGRDRFALGDKQRKVWSAEYVDRMLAGPVAAEPLTAEQRTAQRWSSHFRSHKKRDDLADTLLQGLAFAILRNRKN